MDTSRATLAQWLGRCVHGKLGFCACLAVCLCAELGLPGCTPVWNGYDGIFVAAEPVDLELYRSMLPVQLSMPKEPMVAFYVGNFYDLVPIPVPGSLEPILPYYEAKVFLRCVYNGNEGWHAVSAAVNNKAAMTGGRMIGFPKFIPKSMTLTKTDSGWIGDVRDDDKVYYHLELTRGGIDEQALAPWQREFLAGKKYSNISSTLHQVVPPVNGFIVMSFPILTPPPRRELVTGMVSVQLYAPFNGLLPSKPLPGLYMKFDVNPNRFGKTDVQAPGESDLAQGSVVESGKDRAALESPKLTGQTGCVTWSETALPGPGLLAFLAGLRLLCRRKLAAQKSPIR